MSVTNSPITKIAVQLLLVILLSICGTFIAEMLDYKGYINLLVLLVCVAIIVYLLNTGGIARMFAFVTLSVVSFLVIGITGHVLGYAD